MNDRLFNGEQVLTAYVIMPDHEQWQIRMQVYAGYMRERLERRERIVGVRQLKQVYYYVPKLLPGDPLLGSDA